MREPPHHGVPQHALLAAATAPVVRFHHPAGQHRPARLESLANHFKAELIDTAERGQVRTGEGSVAHVEVFQMSATLENEATSTLENEAT